MKAKNVIFFAFVILFIIADFNNSLEKQSSLSNLNLKVEDIYKNMLKQQEKRDSIVVGRHFHICTKSKNAKKARLSYKKKFPPKCFKHRRSQSFEFLTRQNCKTCETEEIRIGKIGGDLKEAVEVSEFNLFDSYK